MQKYHNFIYTVNSIDLFSYRLPRVSFPNYVCFLYHDARSPKHNVVLIIEDSWLKSNPRNSVGLLWISDQTEAETADNSQHSQEKNIHTTGGIRTHNPIKPMAADPRLKPSGHWDQQWRLLKCTNIGFR